MDRFKGGFSGRFFSCFISRFRFFAFSPSRSYSGLRGERVRVGGEE